MSKIKLNLLNILESIEKIQNYTQPFNEFEELEDNEMVFDATMMQFITIGESIKKLPDEFKETHANIPWQDALDFRNIAAHNYFGLNTEEVWQIIQIHLPKFKMQISALLKKI